MSPHKFCLIALLIAFSTPSYAVTLSDGETDYSTTADITISGVGISTNLEGTASPLNKITNLHTITTSGVTSAYGIKSTKDYNHVINSSGAAIVTQDNSGRGISVTDLSQVNNQGAITTNGTTSYGVYVGGDNSTVSNSGSITTHNSTSYGVYLNGDNNVATNSGTIDTKVYGIYGKGNENQISNSGTITTTSGSSAHGIYVNSASASTATSSSFNTIDNSGTINANAHGIYNKDDYTKITNSGDITTASGSGNNGIRNEGEGGVITNSGIVNSDEYAIYNSGTNAIINNSGTLNGAVLLGNGTLNIFGGSISGIVDGSSSTGSVNIGSDSLSATFTQSASFTDLGSLKITTGSVLNSYSSIIADSISLDENATLNLYDGFSISGPITGVSSSSGIVNIQGSSFSPASSLGSASKGLDNLNINSGGSFSASSNVYVANILVNNGSFNLDGTDGLTISGNLSGGGSGQVNIGSNSQVVSGNLTLTSGDSLNVSLSGGSAGNLSVGGAAVIDGNSNLKITTSSDQGYITSGSNFTIVSAADGSGISDINDSNISINNSTSNRNGLLTYTTSVVADSLVLTINRLEAAQATNNKNSQKIYQNIGNIGANASGKLSEFQSYLDNSDLSSLEITQTINQLSSQSTKAILASNINIIGNSMKSVEGRLNNSKKYSEGLWMKTFGSSASQEQVGDDDGYNANSFGFIIAADQRSDNYDIYGASLSYSNSTIKSSDNLKSNLVDIYQVNFYRKWDFSKYFLDAVGGFAWSEYKSNRVISAVNANAGARFNGQSYATKIKAGSKYQINDNFNVTPAITVNFIRNNIGGYSEDGADSLNLKVEKISADFLETRAGVKMGWNFRPRQFPEFNKISTHFKISYGYSFINDAPETVSRFEGQNTSFSNEISQIDRTSIKIGTQISAYHMDDITFSADYDFEHRETYKSHFISFRMRQEF